MLFEKYVIQKVRFSAGFVKIIIDNTGFFQLNKKIFVLLHL